ncbi:MAG: fatty acid desaturase [Oculatellaceae cyanobacterium bins.114]|nr:fatty acid desaturase [Oculatellaceae cyanobacterium bins.114]
MTAALNQSLSDLNIYSRRDKPSWNAIALIYIIGGYGSGLALILLPSGWLNGLGVLLLSHTLFLSAVMTHEFMHSTIFAQQKWNELGGNVMIWMNGGCYARFRDLTRWHIAHHIERADFPPVNLAEFLQTFPAVICRIIYGLEWLYFPAIAFLMQWRALTRPFWSGKRQDERWRTSMVLLIRGSLFALLAWVSLKALLLYFLSYIGMHFLMQIMNAFFHTYEPFSANMTITQRDWIYEQANSFSCLVSQNYGWLNLLVLNFGYHNAHHAVMRCPWHSLPELDQDLIPHQPNAPSHRFSVWQMLGNYHTYRLARLQGGHGQVIDEAGNYNLANFRGDVGVGFMVLPV